MPRSLSAWLASEHGLLRCARNDGFALMQSYPKPIRPLLLGKLRLVKVENFPCMAIQVKKPALVHKAVVFSGAVFHPVSRQSLVDERIDFGATGDAQRHKGRRTCMGIRHRLGREARKKWTHE